jgi:hypothetical protein
VRARSSRAGLAWSESCIEETEGTYRTRQAMVACVLLRGGRAGLLLKGDERKSSSCTVSVE